MSAPTQQKWSFEADYLQACSCDYGCPCEFEAPPTRGFCQGMGAWRINQGRYGDVPLDGLGLAFVVQTPEAMHKGNGIGGVFIDERATPAQRHALVQIASGQAGGMPFEIFNVIMVRKLPPQFVPINFHLDGRNSSVQVGKAMTLALEPVKNPVNGEPESIRVEHATGFIFKSADVASAKTCRAELAGEPVLTFSWPDKAGFVTQVKYGN